MSTGPQWTDDVRMLPYLPHCACAVCFRATGVGYERKPGTAGRQQAVATGGQVRSSEMDCGGESDEAEKQQTGPLSLIFLAPPPPQTFPPK